MEQINPMLHSLRIAKLAQMNITLVLDDTERITGQIEDLNKLTVKIRQVSGVAIVPLAEIVDVIPSNCKPDDGDWLLRKRTGEEFYRSINGEHDLIRFPSTEND